MPWSFERRPKHRQELVAHEGTQAPLGPREPGVTYDQSRAAATCVNERVVPSNSSKVRLDSGSLRPGLSSLTFQTIAKRSASGQGSACRWTDSSKPDRRRHRSDRGHMRGLADRRGAGRLRRCSLLLHKGRAGRAPKPGRYVGLERQQDDGEPFEDTTNRLVVELREQRARSTRLATVGIPAPRREL